MKKYVFLLGIVFLTSSCGAPNSNKDASFGKTNDTMALGEKVESDKIDRLEKDSELNEIVKSFDSLVLDTVIIDSVFNVGADKVEFLFKHYANRAKEKLVPEKYTRIYGLCSYVVPEFVSSIQLKREDAIVLDTILNKDIFIEMLPAELVENGTMLYPSISFDKYGMVIRYSVSIPLTDIGKRVLLHMDYNGGLAVGEE